MGPRREKVKLSTKKKRALWRRGVSREGRKGGASPDCFHRVRSVKRGEPPKKDTTPIRKKEKYHRATEYTFLGGAEDASSTEKERGHS